MKSQLHKDTLKVLKECYPLEKIREEHPIKIGNKTLYLDLYIPRIKLGIECQGKQHFEFNKFHYQDANAFREAKRNDLRKEDECKELGITLIKVNYNEDMTKDLLLSRILEVRQKDIQES